MSVSELTIVVPPKNFVAFALLGAFVDPGKPELTQRYSESQHLGPLIADRAFENFNPLVGVFFWSRFGWLAFKQREPLGRSNITRV